MTDPLLWTLTEKRSRSEHLVVADRIPVFERTIVLDSCEGHETDSSSSCEHRQRCTKSLGPRIGVAQ